MEYNGWLVPVFCSITTQTPILIISRDVEGQLDNIKTEIVREMRETKGNVPLNRFNVALVGNKDGWENNISQILCEFLRQQKLGLGDILKLEREDLIGNFMGHTPHKINEVFEEAAGSTLLINLDRLVLSDYDTFGKEAWEVLKFHMKNNLEVHVLLFSKEKHYSDDIPVKFNIIF